MAGAAIVVIGGCAYEVVKDSHNGQTPNDAIRLTPLDKKSIYWNNAQNLIEDLKNRVSNTIGFLEIKLDRGTKELQSPYQKNPQTLHIDTIFTQYTPVEQEYNDAKRKGIPTKNYNQKDDRENIDLKDKDSREQNKDLHYKPFSCCFVFENKRMKDLGCPKQIRYFDKNGDADIDIDLYHTQDTTSKLKFPHWHKWTGKSRSRDHKYDGMEAVKQTWDEIWKKNKCPNNYYGV